MQKEINYEEIMVSICCIAYNHEKYISDAINGFLLQETNFKYEILIHDDASTDHTADIIREYSKKYPDTIHAFFQNENQYSKKIKILANFVYPHAKGKYIALCEGDDYWTDKNKLQFQVDFLENNRNYMGIAHNVKYYNDPDNEKNINEEFYGKNEDTVFTIKNLIKGECVIAHTCSFVYRNFFTKELLEKMKSDDFPGINHIEIHFWLAIQGGIYYSKKIMATNRYIMNRRSTNWRSQFIEHNYLGVIYDYFPRLEKMARTEFGIDVDLGKIKENHFKQMVIRVLRRNKKEDIHIMFNTMRKSGKYTKYIFIMLYVPIYQILKIVKDKIFGNKKTTLI
jgi:glycosyltransferase involved in cell wall biosynthesis